MHVTVLGAGVVGVATAWYLRRAGHDVTVIDRQPAAGFETGFAHGSDVPGAPAGPWEHPSAPAKLLRWLVREDAPLLFRLRADPAQWRWVLGFLRECAPVRTRRNIAQIVALGLYSRACLRELRKQLALDDQRADGLLHFYTDQREFDAAQAPAQVMREHGCELEMLDADACVQREPALADCRARLVGGSLTPADESGDAHRFTQALARHAAARGVDFRYGMQVLGFEHDGGRLARARCVDSEGRQQVWASEAWVMCLGSYSRQVAAELGIRLDIVPAKGYSVTLPVTAPERSFRAPLTDDAHKLVFSRLGDRLRVAGTAELAGYDRGIDVVRCQAIVRRVRELFPRLTDGRNAQFWSGPRPTAPSSLPYIGRSRWANLFLNTGHGTLGWTHSCGSAAALADIVDGRDPGVDFAFC